MLRNPPRDAVPNLIPLALERATQLLTSMFWQMLFGSCDLRQIASSVASKNELVSFTPLQSTMSMPSLFQKALLSTVMRSMLRFSHWS